MVILRVSTETGQPGTQSTHQPAQSQELMPSVRSNQLKLAQVE